ncbi:O-antigen/teichoic acid export membrane protein [Bradyrhizobium sp. USDA 372]
MTIAHSLTRSDLSATGRRIVRGTSANAFTQVVIILVQLLLVPTMAASWGIDQYGRWLLLFTIPSYLALSDLGFATAATTKMTMDVAEGRLDDALRTFQSTIVVVLGISLAVGIAGAVAILVPPNAYFSKDASQALEVKGTLLALLIYGLICLQGSLLQAGFRCSGHYAVGTLLQACLQLMEGAVALLIVKLGGSILGVASGYLVTRSILLGGQLLILARLVRWLSFGIKHCSLADIRQLLHPALAVMALPAAQSLFLQGSAIVLGMTASPAAVATFTTVRTLTRAGVQFTTLVNHALMPEAAAAAALNQTQKLKKLLYLTLVSSLVVTLPGSAILLLFGQQLVELWTAHTINPTYALVATMTTVMLVNGMWHPLSNLLLAVNRQATYSYVFLGAVAASLGIGFFLSRALGEAGMAMSILLLDLFMLQHVARHAWKAFIVIAPPKEVIVPPLDVTRAAKL